MIDSRIVAVDFDGTLCENCYPEIGAEKRGMVAHCKNLSKNGTKLILWTCRTGMLLIEALQWCADRGLLFDAVNENLPECIEEFGGDTRKIFAHEYIDDRSRGAAAFMDQGERLEFFGCLIDVVEDWLESKGISTDDIENPDREGEDAAIIFGDDYDYLADRFAQVIGIERNDPNLFF